MAITDTEGGWSPSPGTRSFATLKTVVARYVLMPDDEEGLAVAGDGINDAIRELNLERWYWALVSQDLTLAADDSDYTLNTAFSMPRAAELLDSSSNPVRRMAFMDWKTFTMSYPKRDTSGSPEVYTIRNVHDDGLVQLSAPPSSSFVSSYPTLRVHYYKRIAILSGNADEIDVPSEVELYVTWSAKRYIAAIFDQNKLALADTMASRAWKALRRKNTIESDSDWDEG